MDNKIRVKQSNVNIDDGKISRIERYAWNGEKCTGYAEQPSSSDSRVTGSVANRPKSILKIGFWRTPLEQQVFDLDQPLAEVLDLAEWKLSGPVLVGTSSAWCIESVGLREGHWRLKVWIDPEKDFAPVQMELRIDGDGQHDVIEKMTNVKLEKENDVWVIKGASVLLENPFLEKHKYAAMQFAAHVYRLGVDVSNDDFTIAFPRGTWVYDEISEMGYIVGEGTWIIHPDGKNEFVQVESLDGLEKIPGLAMHEEVGVKKQDSIEDANRYRDPNTEARVASASDIDADNPAKQTALYVIYGLLIITFIAILSFLVRKRHVNE